MKVRNIRKVGKNKYEIEIENYQKIKTFDTVMLKYQLLLKKEISDALLETIQEETKNAEIYEKTLQFVNRKLRSKKEVMIFLEKQKIQESLKKEILEKLEEQGFFQEQSYIDAYVHDRMSFSNDGPNKIREELFNQGFDHEKVEEAISFLSEEEIQEKLSKLIQKKMHSNHRYSEAYFKQKTLDQMIMLGYPKSMVQEQLEQFEMNHDDILKHEAEKLLSKYQNKKSGKELYYFVTQKLYQKRYPMDEIHQVIEEIIKEKG